MELATSSQSSIRIHLDSEYAIMSDNIYTFNITNKSINATTGNNILIQVLDGVFPHSFYPIDNSNNKLSWEYGGQGQDVIIVTPGHYSASELCTELLNDMSGGRPDLKVTFNPKNNKVTFSDPIVNITLKSNGTILSTLGFDTTSDITGNNLSGSNQINLSGPDSFYLHIDNLDLQNIDPSGNTDNLLARIPIISSFNGYTFYYNERNSPNILSNKSISEFKIRLEDKSGKHINFNGLHWSITLGVMFATSKDSGFYDTLQF